MNKNDLIAAIADATELSRADSGRALDALIAGITEALKRHEDVSLVGFGSFGVKTRTAREGRNPQTGQAIQIPEMMVPAFRPGKTLKDAVSGQ